MPPMPTGYSNDMLNLIKWMLHKTPESRPSVKRILSDSYIRKYIQIFIEEANQQKERLQPQQPRLGHGVPALGSTGGDRDSNNSTISSNTGGGGQRVPSVDRDRDREQQQHERERDRDRGERDRDRDQQPPPPPERMLSPSGAASSHRGAGAPYESPSPIASRHPHASVSQANSGGSGSSALSAAAAAAQRPITPLSRDDQRGPPPPRPPPPAIASASSASSGYSSSSSGSQPSSSALPNNPNSIYVPDAPGPYAKLMALPQAPPPPPPPSSSHFIAAPQAMHMYLPPPPSIPPSQVEPRAPELVPPAADRLIFGSRQPPPMSGAPERGDLRELRAERERKDALPIVPPLVLMLAPTSIPAPVPVYPTPGSTSAPAPAPVAPPRVFQPPPDKLPVAPPPPPMFSQPGDSYEAVQVQMQTPASASSVQSFLPPSTQSTPSQAAATTTQTSSSASGGGLPASHSEPGITHFLPPPLPQKDYGRGDPARPTVRMLAHLFIAVIYCFVLVHTRLCALYHY